VELSTDENTMPIRGFNMTKEQTVCVCGGIVNWEMVDPDETDYDSIEFQGTCERCGNVWEETD
jgi:hypothetical protein